MLVKPQKKADRSEYQDQGKRLTEQTLPSKKKYKRNKEKVEIEKNDYGNYYEIRK